MATSATQAVFLKPTSLNRRSAARLFRREYRVLLVRLSFSFRPQSENSYAVTSVYSAIVNIPYHTSKKTFKRKRDNQPNAPASLRVFRLFLRLDLRRVLNRTAWSRQGSGRDGATKWILESARFMMLSRAGAISTQAAEAWARAAL